MSLNSTKRYFSLGIRGVRNYIFNKPFCASFEVTYNCNARCQHCHLGGMIKGEKQTTAEEFARRARELKPVVAQVSGGEPLLRRDIDNIVQALRHPHRAPYIVLTTNASLLNEKKYRALKESGVDEFSISLDYPDERHDKFRGIPGLFDKIEKLCLDLRGEKNKGITLSCVVHRYNYKDMLRLAEKAYQWQVKMNFSAYTWLRTNQKDFIIPQENLPELNQMINQLQNFRLSHNTVFTSDYVFGKIVNFFREQGQEDC
ncbi:MAG: radical SAM protein, partial [Acidobacteriota bacterium]